MWGPHGIVETARQGELAQHSCEGHFSDMISLTFAWQMPAADQPRTFMKEVSGAIDTVAARMGLGETAEPQTPRTPSFFAAMEGMADAALKSEVSEART